MASSDVLCIDTACTLQPRWKSGRQSPPNPERDLLARFLLIHQRRGIAMDILYLGLAVGFFALSWAFIEACERLS
jgi:hypothetical protein